MTPAAVSVGELHHVSASQITNFRLCPRRWWFDKVAKFPREESLAALLGVSIHGQMEGYYVDGVLPEHPSARLLATSGLIPDRGGLFLAEHPNNFKLNIFASGVELKGKIDLVDYTEMPRTLNIWDWKSKKDFSYALSVDELERDLQMNIYGRWAFEDVAGVKLKHVRYHHANIKTGDKSSGYKIVSSEKLTREHVDGYFAQVVEPVVDEMKQAAACSSFTNVTANEQSCYAFNKPCQFIDKCFAGKEAGSFLGVLFNKERGSGMGKRDGGEYGATTLTELGKRIAENDLVGMATASSTAPAGLTLYINALPVKGVHNITFLDDIIAEASKEICAAKKVLDLRLLAYAEGKGLLAAGLRHNPPSGTVVATSGELSDVAIEALIPLASVVIRGTR